MVLALVLHGSGGTAEIMSVYAAMPSHAVARGVITVTPDAIDGSWESRQHGRRRRLPDGPPRRHRGSVLHRSRSRPHGRAVPRGAGGGRDRRRPSRPSGLDRAGDGGGPARWLWSDVRRLFHGMGDHVVPYGEGADAGVVVGGSNGGLPGVSVNMPEWALGAGCSDQPEVVRIEPRRGALDLSRLCRGPRRRVLRDRARRPHRPARRLPCPGRRRRSMPARWRSTGSPRTR